MGYQTIKQVVACIGKRRVGELVGLVVVVVVVVAAEFCRADSPLPEKSGSVPVT